MRIPNSSRFAASGFISDTFSSHKKFSTPFLYVLNTHDLISMHMMKIPESPVYFFWQNTLKIQKFNYASLFHL